MLPNDFGWEISDAGDGTLGASLVNEMDIIVGGRVGWKHAAHGH